MKRRLLYILAFLLATLQTFAQTYTYDKNNRLTKVEYDNGTTISYTYDALGNRLSKKVTGEGEEPVDPDATAYAWLSADGKTLTFCYDGKRSERTGTTYDLKTEEYVAPGWFPGWDDASTVSKVVFDPSFANARPVYTSYWFVNMKDVTDIQGMNYLNTSEVKGMYNMFNGCTSLTNLDLSHFETSNVTNMGQMFDGCSGLKSINLSSFNTSKVTDFAFMFRDCSSLTNLDLSSFNTSSAKRMAYMFAKCNSLTELNISHFDTSTQTESSYMLWQCSSLNSLSISTTMSNLESDACYGVGTAQTPCAIVAPDGFDFGVDTSAGTFAWKGGWFKLSAGTTAYAWLSSDGKTLTFCYDGKRMERTGETFDLNNGGIPAWNLDYWDNPQSVVSVVFEPTFANVKPTSTNFWFCNFNNLENIEGINYLNTSEVTNMTRMFSYCNNLKELDVSHFDTSKVTALWGIFVGCSSLTSLDISHFNVSKVKDLSLLFAFCHNLESLDVSNFDTSNATNMYMMFEGCNKIKSIDLSHFDTSNVTDFGYMFSGCSGLTSLDVSNFNMSNLQSSTQMFSNCNGLQSLCISSTMNLIADNACEGTGTAERPCTIIAPDGFDFGVDTSAGTFAWKGGWFTLPVSVAQTLEIAQGWNWISTYLGNELDVQDLPSSVSRLLSQTQELVNDPEYGLVGNLKTIEPGKAYKLEASKQFQYGFRGYLASNRMPLEQGWNWISYPYFKAGTPDAVISNAEDGDYITGQRGFAEYADDNWAGTLSTLQPGEGYLYKSVASKTLAYDFTKADAARQSSSLLLEGQGEAFRRYPNTMNITARISLEGMETQAEGYIVYVLADGELRGISQCIGGTHYLTVYGDQTVPLSFLVEEETTGQTFEARETLSFVSDVVGSRRQPFVFTISSVADRLSSPLLLEGPGEASVYTLEGILVSRKATPNVLQQLPKGVYIVGGRKVCIK